MSHVQRTPAYPPRIVVIGGGFAGLRVAKGLSGRGAAITLVDRHNYHVFQPLLYQVATAVLSPGDIAAPLRRILRRHHDVATVLGDAQHIDTTARTVTLDHRLPQSRVGVAAVDVVARDAGSQRAIDHS